MYREFFSILSQNPEYGKSVCVDTNNPFLFHVVGWFFIGEN